MAWRNGITHVYAASAYANMAAIKRRYMSPSPKRNRFCERGMALVSAGARPNVGLGRRSGAGRMLLFAEGGRLMAEAGSWGPCAHGGIRHHFNVYGAAWHQAASARSAKRAA